MKGQMFRYILKRTLISLATLFCVLLFVFFAARLTGNPFEVMYPEGMEPGQLEKYNEEYGLDQSFVQQFADYMANVLHGDFGISLVDKRPVTDIFFEKAVETLKLGVIAFFVSVTIGVANGIFIATNQDKLICKIINHIISALYAIPGFVIAIFLILIFGYYFHILPTFGGGTPAHYVMPVICLSVGPIISITRHVCNGVKETLSQDYIRTAVSKGVGRKQVILKHAFRNALIPTLTIIGMVVVDVITGSMVVETVFAWPGLGMTLVSSVMNRDFSLIQFGVVFLSAIVIAINYILDILYMQKMTFFLWQFLQPPEREVSQQDLRLSIMIRKSSP